MPQLDFNNPLTIAQVVWMALIFGTLYLLMARWALPLVASVVDARATSIAADLESAREAKAQADAAMQQLVLATRVAHAEAQGEIAAALAKAKAEAAEQARAMGERLDQQIATAEQRIGAARMAALGALRQITIETTGMVVQRVTGHSADETTISSAVDHALTAHHA